MRILVVAPELPPALGGMKTFADGLIRQFLTCGHQMLVLTRAAESAEVRLEAAAYDRALGVPVRRFMRDEDFRADLMRCSRYVGEFRPAVVLVLNSAYARLAEAVAVPVVCRANGNDVLYPWVGPDPSLRQLLGLRRGGATYGATGIGRLPASDQGFLRRLAMRLRYRWRRASVLRGLRRAAAVGCNSRWTARELVALGVPRERVVLMIGGVDGERFHPGPAGAVRERLGCPPEAVLLLSVCRLLKGKGLDDAVAAVARVRERHPAIRHVIVGDGPEWGPLEAQVERLGLGGVVTLLGHVWHRDLPEWYRAADIFVQPSRMFRRIGTGAGIPETGGNTFPEASASGLPILATSTGGIVDLVEDGTTGILVPPGDVDALAWALARLVSNPILRRQMGQAGRRKVETELSWVVVGRRWEDLLLRYALREDDGGLS